MDGLIPMVFKSLKRSKTRRHYQYLSSPAPATSTHTYNISDFYISENDYRDYLSRKQDQDQQQHVKPRPDNHRRCNSVQVSRGYGWEDQESKAGSGKAKQLVRFRSHRMFSCVTGA